MLPGHRATIRPTRYRRAPPKSYRHTWRPRPELLILPPPLQAHGRSGRRERRRIVKPDTRHPKRRILPGYWGESARAGYRIANDALDRYELFMFAPADARDYAAPNSTYAALPFTTPVVPLPDMGAHRVGLVVRKRNKYGLTDYVSNEHPVDVYWSGGVARPLAHQPFHVKVVNNADGDVVLTAYYVEDEDGSTYPKQWLYSYEAVTADGVVTAGYGNKGDTAPVGGMAILHTSIVTGLADGTIITIQLWISGGTNHVSVPVTITHTIDTSAPSATTIKTSLGTETEQR